MIPRSSDDLAFRCTLLASQRTLLSFTRTALALFGTGVALVKLFHAPVMHAIGWTFMPLSAVVFGVGLLGFWRTSRWLLQKAE